MQDCILTKLRLEARGRGRQPGGQFDKGTVSVHPKLDCHMCMSMEEGMGRESGEPG